MHNSIIYSFRETLTEKVLFSVESLNFNKKITVRTLLTFSFLVISVISSAQSWMEIEKKLPPPLLIEQNEQYFGCEVSVSGNTAVIGAYGHDVGGSAFIYEYNGADWIFQARLYPSGVQPYDLFGIAVDISGDDVIIGATGDDLLGGNAGIAYIFSKPLGGWSDTTETATLTGSDIGASDGFGRSVSIHDSVAVVGSFEGAYLFEKTPLGWMNGTQSAILSRSDGLLGGFASKVSVFADDIAVGAELDNYSGTQSGSVFIYTKPSTGWSNSFETAKLNPSDAQSGDFFGTSVVLDNGILLIGASGDDDLGFNVGSAYVFKKPFGGWVNATENFKVLPNVGSPNARFGKSLDISGFNFVIGAENAEYGNANTGLSYVFEADLLWTNASELAVIRNSNGLPFDAFGGSSAIEGDHILTGSSGDDENGLNSGLAFHFKKNPTGWTDTVETNIVAPPNYYYPLNGSSLFGASVAVDSNIAVVGAYYYGIGYYGAAFVYEFDSVQWNYRAMLSISDSDDSDEFGYSVDISGDVIVVGAWKDGGTSGSSGTAAEGGAYVFVKPVSGWNDMTETAKLLRTDPLYQDNFGNSVSIYDDDIVIGCYRDDDNGSASGSAYVYSKPLTGWLTMTETAKLKASDGINGDNLGISVDNWGNAIVIGNDPSPQIQAKAYVYEKPQSGWVNSNETAHLTTSIVATDDGFGTTVRICDSIIAVGAVSANGVFSGAGAVYLFKKSSTGWQSSNEIAHLVASDGQYDARFGTSVAFTDSTLIVGSPHATLFNPLFSSYSEGAIYSFEKPASGWINDTATYKKLPNVLGTNRFGQDVAIADGHLIVGADYDNDFGQYAGAAYFYKECTPTFNSISVSACQNYISPSGLILDSTGTYIDNILNSEGCDSIITINLVVNTVDTTIYVDTNILMSNHIGGNYQWIDCTTGAILIGETLQAYTPIASQGSYQVIVDDNGCTDTSDCVFFQDCYPTTNTLIVESCGQYVSPSGNHIYDSSGIYSDTLVNSFGCDSIISISLQIININLNVVVNGYGVELFSLQNSGSYQWVNCDNGFTPIVGATGQFYVFQNNGNYAAVLTLNGCSDTTECYAVFQVGLDNFNIEPTSVFPNPSNGIYYMDNSTNVESIIVLNYLGEYVQEMSWSQPDEVINLTDLPAGIYTLKLVGSTRNRFVKISKI